MGALNLAYIDLIVAAHTAGAAGFSAGDSGTFPNIRALLSQGTGTNQADRAATAADVAVAGSATSTIDFSTTTKTGDGTALAAVELRLLVIVAHEDNAADINLKAGATNGNVDILADVSDIHAIPAGSVFFQYWPVDGTGPTIGASTKTIDLVNVSASESKFSWIALACSA